MFSLDISMHKRGIDIKSLKNEGLVHLYLKATEGRNYVDPCLEEFYNQASNLDLPVGYYHFFTKNPDVEGQAEDFYNAVKGKKADLRYCLDMEVDLVNHSELARRFINRFEGLMGKKDICCIYASAYYARDNFDQDIKDKYPLWVANYNSTQNVETGWREIAGWQYSESEIHQGQECDANIFYGSIVIPNNQSTTVTQMNNIIAQGQGHANNFAGCGLVIDGIRGAQTAKASIMVLQQGMNKDYGSGLVLDGVFGSYSQSSLSGHTVREGETQYMVTALEILLMLRGYDPQGVECPGVFGSKLAETLRKYQSDNRLVVDGIAGEETFKSLIG